MTNWEGYSQHKLSALIVIADASGAVSAGLDYTLSTNGSTLHTQAAAPPIQNLYAGPSITTAAILLSWCIRQEAITITSHVAA